MKIKIETGIYSAWINGEPVYDNLCELIREIIEPNQIKVLDISFDPKQDYQYCILEDVDHQKYYFKTNGRKFRACIGIINSLRLNKNFYYKII